jgi:hypothetical protein
MLTLLKLTTINFDEYLADCCPDDPLRFRQTTLQSSGCTLPTNQHALSERYFKATSLIKQLTPPWRAAAALHAWPGPLVGRSLAEKSHFAANQN